MKSNEHMEIFNLVVHQLMHLAISAGLDENYFCAVLNTPVWAQTVAAKSFGISIWMENIMSPSTNQVGFSNIRTNGF